MANADLFIVGEIAERKFEANLLWRDIKYKKIGQENWMPKWMHEKIRYIYDRIEIDLLRHQPDFATDKALIQVKNASNCDDYPTVTIQKKSYEIAKYWCKLDIPVLIIWLFPDDKFYGNWADHIEVEESKTQRTELTGSRTPMFIVRKHQLKPLSDFLNELR